MAKGMIALAAFREKYGRTDRRTIQRALHDAFLKAIRGEGA